jgi:biotin carboxylase
MNSLYGRTILIRGPSRIFAPAVFSHGGPMPDPTERFLLVASYEKGHDFMRQCDEMGIRSTLLTLDSLLNADWPREALEELVTMPSGLTHDQILNTVSWMARGRRFDRVVALDEFDLQTAAQLREHMRIPGMGITTSACYRDKLAMRVIARATGFLVPDFCRVLNYDELREFMDRVPPPWLIKPRTEASAVGIRRVHEPEELWRILDELGDRQSHHILEQFVPGDNYHVDSIVSECKVAFSVVHRYGRPPMQVMHDGGVFTTRTVDRSSRDWAELTAFNASLAPSLGMVRGVTHAEFIRGHADGRYYFLEIAARVGGAFIADLVEFSTGVNLWREWAKIEAAHLRGQAYTPPAFSESYAGSVLCLAQTADPDTSAFNAPEIVHRMKKHHHAGLIVRSDSPQRVEHLLNEYSAEFAARFLAALPPMERLTPA